MRRARVGIVLLTVIAVISIGAAVATFGADTLSNTEDKVTLEPADGPNGEYARIQNGELELVFSDANTDVEGEGFSAGATTRIHDVFVISYSGSNSAEVWLTDDSDDVSFYVADDPDRPLEGETNRATLGPDGSLLVGIEVNVTDDGAEQSVESVDSIDVHARELTPTPTPATPTPTPTPATPTPTPATPTPATPTPTPGDDDGTGGGGGVPIGGGGGGGGGVPIGGGFDGGTDGDAEIQDVTVLDERVLANGTAGVRVELINSLSGDDRITLAVQEDGQNVTRRTVRMEGLSQRSVTLEYPPTETGEQTVAVNNITGGEVRVVPVPTGTPTGPEFPPGLIVAQTTQPVEDDAPGRPGVRVEFQRTDVDAITFLSGAEGTVEVTELEALPPRDPEQPAELVLPVDIDVPPALDDQPATVRFDVDRDLVAEADVRPESLRVVRLDDGTWEPVSSDVTVDGDQVDVRVDVPGFSRYAVVGQPETPTPTDPAPTPTATATDTATVAPGSPTPAPGTPFGLGLGELVALVAVVALVVAALLLARDRLPFEEH